MAENGKPRGGHHEIYTYSCRPWRCCTGSAGERAIAQPQGLVIGDRPDDRDDGRRDLQGSGLPRIGHRGRPQRRDIVQLRGDDAGPHTIENSQRKAYTARTFRISSGEFVQRVKDNPTTGAVHLTGIVAAQGALPIKIGDEVIGAAGVSGAPGGDKDEACVKAGLDKVADQLK